MEVQRMQTWIADLQHLGKEGRPREVRRAQECPQRRHEKSKRAQEGPETILLGYRARMGGMGGMADELKFEMRS